MVRVPSFAVSAFLCLAGISSEGVNAFAPTGGVTQQRVAGGHARIAKTAPSAGRKGSTSLFMSSRQQTGRDFYRILGINRNADSKEIKSAFRKMAKQYHPGTSGWEKEFVAAGVARLVRGSEISPFMELFSQLFRARVFLLMLLLLLLSLQTPTRERTRPNSSRRSTAPTRC